MQKLVEATLPASQSGPLGDLQMEEVMMQPTSSAVATAPPHDQMEEDPPSA